MSSGRDTLTIHDDHEYRLAGYWLDNTSVCVFRLNQEGGIQYASRDACDALGYSKDELQEMSVFDVDPSTDKEM